MKKFLITLLAAAMLLPMAACGGGNTPAETTDAATHATEEKTESPTEPVTDAVTGAVTDADTDTEAVTVLKAWSGKFSEEKLKSTINEYQNDYANIVLEKGGSSSISFETDFEVSSCSVTRLSRVDDTDVEVELHSYIDLYLEPNCDGRTVTIPVDWWYAKADSWVNDFLIWSYLVYVEDVNGNNHYYYYRVDYSAYAQ